MKAATSVEAYRSIDITELEGKVLEVIDLAGVNGCISDEVLACYPKLSYSSVTARFSSLEKKGEIYRAGDMRPGLSGRRQQVMRITKHLAVAPIRKPPKPPPVVRSGFLKGLMFATKIILKEPDFVSAKRALKTELLKTAKRTK